MKWKTDAQRGEFTAFIGPLHAWVRETANGFVWDLIYMQDSFGGGMFYEHAEDAKKAAEKAAYNIAKRILDDLVLSK